MTNAAHAASALSTVATAPTHSVSVICKLPPPLDSLCTYRVSTEPAGLPFRRFSLALNREKVLQDRLVAASLRPTFVILEGRATRRVEFYREFLAGENLAAPAFFYARVPRTA